MKIHKIKFKNINSLKGQWEIDFDNPELTRENIFLITGKTGSGKSSIFDAITLALYGETTRQQGKISGSSNELMNKHSGECSSEVTFSSKGIKYLATFTQHKSRKSPLGKLQGKSQSLINLNNQENLVSKNVKLEEAIEKIIGLNFKQFSKTVMLAQGSFDKFLKAKDDEKADILEQITGTQIYTQISKKIFDHEKEEKLKLENLKEQLGDIEILSDQEIKEKLEEKKYFENEIIKREKEISNLDKILKYYTKQNELKIKQNSLLTIKEELANKKEEHINKQLKLEKYNNAKEIITLHREVKSLDIKLNEEIENKKNLENIKKETKEKQDKLIKEKSNLFLENQEKEQELDKLSKTIFEVRKLDKSIEKENSNLKLLINNLDHKETTYTKTDDQITENLTLLSLKEESLNKSKIFIDKNKHINKYEKNQENILNNLELFNDINKKTIELKSTLIKAKENASSIDKKYNKNLKDYEKIKNEVESIEKEIASFNSTYEEITDSVIEKQSTLLTLKSKLSNYKKYYENKSKLEELLKEELKLESKSKHLQEKITNQKKIIELEQEIMGLKRFTHLIKKGEDCPLCGSKEHPNITQGDDSKLKAAKEKLEELINNHDKILTSISDYTSEITRLEYIQEELHKALIEKKYELLSQDDYQSTINNSIEKLNTQINKLNSKQERIKELNKERSNKSTALEKARANYTISKSEKSNNEKEIKTLDLTIKSNNEKIEKLNNELDNFVISYSYKELNKLFSTYNDNKKNYNTLFEEITNLKNKIEEDKTSKSILSKDITQLKDEKLQLEKKINDIKKQRYFLFKDKDCDTELKEQTNKLKKLDELIKTNLEQLTPINETIIKLSENINHNTQNIDDKTKQLKAIDKKIENLLIDRGIQSVETALKYSLQEDEITIINAFIKEYEKKDFQYQTLSLDIEKDIKNLQTQDVNISEYSAKEKKITLTKLKDETLTKKIIIDQELKVNTDNTKKFKDKEEIINKQINISNKWSILNSAIGSADGKKFKTIAQAITLDYLVNNTNNKLIELFPRYELYRINENNKASLDLGVIDKYSAAIKRPVSNLSGGETFIISFSLALGLSDLLTKKVSIETLFLDEGFGTLDEETLTQSLEAINNLTNTGKTIGLISHVSLLHDRIRSQIKVQENGDSTSSLSGPGIRKIK